MQQTFIDTLITAIQAHPEPDDALVVIFETVAAEFALSRVLLSTHDSEIEHALHDHVIQRIKGRWQAMGSSVASDASTQDLAANYTASTIRSMVQWWLEHDMPLPPVTMARQLRALIIGGLVRLRRTRDDSAR